MKHRNWRPAVYGRLGTDLGLNYFSRMFRSLRSLLYLWLRHGAKII